MGRHRHGLDLLVSNARPIESATTRPPTPESWCPPDAPAACSQTSRANKNGCPRVSSIERRQHVKCDHALAASGPIPHRQAVPRRTPRIADTPDSRHSSASRSTTSTGASASNSPPPWRLRARLDQITSRHNQHRIRRGPHQQLPRRPRTPAPAPRPDHPHHDHRRPVPGLGQPLQSTNQQRRVPAPKLLHRQPPPFLPPTAHPTHRPSGPPSHRGHAHARPPIPGQDRHAPNGP